MRGRRSIALTEAGEIFLRHAAAIVARLSAAHADFTALAKGAAGTLRVGTFESSGTGILPLLLRAFRPARPKVEIRLTEAAKDDQLLALVERGELDVSLRVWEDNSKASRAAACPVSYTCRRPTPIALPSGKRSCWDPCRRVATQRPATRGPQRGRAVVRWEFAIGVLPPPGGSGRFSGGVPREAR